MSSRPPMVRQTAWISIIPHFIIMGLIIFAWYLFIPQKAFMYGAATYLAISFSLRTIIPKNHRQGISLVRNEKFEEAILEFEKSYSFFTKNKWVDTYRFVTVLNSNQMTYTEMALNNIAYCYGQIGNGEKAKKYYNQALEEFPNSGIAKSALRMLNSMENKENS